jgi:hypothetical protein
MWRPRHNFPDGSAPTVPWDPILVLPSRPHQLFLQYISSWCLWYLSWRRSFPCPTHLTPDFFLELSLVYGPKKLSHHGIMTLSSLSETQIPVPHSSLEGSSLTGSHTICADYDKGPAAQRSLLSNLGKDYFHPLYISKRDNAICFIAILNTTTLAVVNQLPSLRFVPPLPPLPHSHDIILGQLFEPHHN